MLYAWVADDSASMRSYFATKDNACTFLLYRLDPVINSYAYTDDHLLNPLAHFGTYVQNRSIPRLKFDVTLDPLDPTLTADHVLKLIAPNQSERVFTSEDGIFVLESLEQAGIYRWTYTVSDSAGNSASESGSFDVLAYSPPRFSALSVHRYTQSVDDEGNPTYTATDDGDRIWFTINADVAPVAGQNAWSIKRLRDDIGETVTLLSGADGDHISQINDRELDTSIYNPSKTIGITLILSDFFETIEQYDIILKAGGYLHVTKNGVAVGMRSTATPETKRFEVAKDYESRFYNGIDYFGGEEAKAKTRRSMGIEICSGKISITPSKSNTPASKKVTFPISFSGTPVVMVTAATTVPGTTVTGVGASGITADECTIYVSRTNTTKTNLHWFAYFSPEATDEDDIE